uniref:Tubulin-specific chaperone E n=2 Tax=Cacopsylla melanoneura TaxID=428564 RepID=A0A8D9DX45_9HEMI
MEDEVGLRVCDSDGYRATIRYVGSVEGTSGVWYGVDWDDGSRGKHDGTHNGVKHFWTHSPKSGSFMRRDKLLFGVSFMEAMVTKYVDAENELIVRENVEEVKASMNAPFLELVGFERVAEEQKSFETLKIVSLMDSRVSHAGSSHDEIERTVPNIEDLDLSRNLLASWFTVGDITRQLKCLKQLNVSNNKLPVPNHMEGVIEQIFPQGEMSTLTLGNMGYIWSDILKLFATFPVTCLKIPANHISTLDSIPNMFQVLEELYLQENNIVDWSEVNALGQLPKLKYLNLASTNLRNIKLDPGGTEGGPPLFPALETLIISDNKIDSWDDVSQLHYLPKLTSLRFTKNPIWSADRVSTSRDKTICRIGTLTVLNGSSIEKQERRGSEYSYIKEYGAVWLSEKNRKQFVIANPRYEYLVNLHGPPLAELSGPAGTTASVATKHIILLNFHHIEEDKVVQKKVPLTLSISKVVNLVQRVFGNPSNVTTMYYTSEKNLSQHIELNPESLAEIGFFDLSEGDTVHVSFEED